MLFISKKKLQEMLREQASSIVKGIQNAESAERTCSNQRKAEHLLNCLKHSPAASKRIHDMVSPHNLAVELDRLSPEAWELLNDASLLEQIKQDPEKTAISADEFIADMHDAEETLAHIKSHSNRARAKDLLKVVEKDPAKLTAIKDSVFCEVLAENARLKRENAALRNDVHRPAMASEICKTPQELIAIWRQEKANLVTEIERLKKRECGLRHEIVLLKAFIDETTGIKVEDEGPSKPLNPEKSPEPETGPECPKDEDKPWGAPEEPRVYIGGNDPNIKVIVQIRSERHSQHVSSSHSEGRKAWKRIGQHQSTPGSQRRDTVTTAASPFRDHDRGMAPGEGRAGC